MAVERGKYEEALNDDEVLEVGEDLRGLTKHSGYPILKELIKGMRIMAREQAMDGPLENMAHWKGYVEGLKDIEALIPSIVEREAEIKRRETKDVKPSGRDAYLSNDSDLSF